MTRAGAATGQGSVTPASSENRLLQVATPERKDCKLFLSLSLAASFVVKVKKTRRIYLQSRRSMRFHVGVAARSSRAISWTHERREKKENKSDRIVARGPNAPSHGRFFTASCHIYAYDERLARACRKQIFRQPMTRRLSFSRHAVGFPLPCVQPMTRACATF